MNIQNCNFGIERILILGSSGYIGKSLMSAFRDNCIEAEVTGRSFPELDLTDYDSTKQLSGFFDLNTAVIMLNSITVNSFPQTISLRSAGEHKSVSSVPRSFSPAQRSMAG